MYPNVSTLNHSGMFMPIHSHASLHEQRLDPGAASSQLKVDRAVGQNHPLAPKASSLEQSDGRQRELLQGEEEEEETRGEWT